MPAVCPKKLAQEKTGNNWCLQGFSRTKQQQVETSPRPEHRDRRSGEMDGAGNRNPVREVNGIVCRNRRKSASGESEEARRRIWDEYWELIAKNAYGVSVETAGAEDVLAFIRGFWIPKHLESCRTTAANGAKVVSVSTVKHVLQHVSKSYELLGREDKQKPVKSECVQSFKEGYKKMLHSLDVQEKKATVFKEGKIEDLVQYMREEIKKKGSGVEQC
jgi:hypothetical protein